jgi:hypothetical protein
VVVEEGAVDEVLIDETVEEVDEAEADEAFTLVVEEEVDDRHL